MGSEYLGFVWAMSLSSQNSFRTIPRRAALAVLTRMGREKSADVTTLCSLS